MHGGCVTVNIWPAMLRVPMRELVFVFAAALKATVPVPVPLAPLVTVSQAVSKLTPVHPHPAARSARAAVAARPTPSTA